MTLITCIALAVCSAMLGLCARREREKGYSVYALVWLGGMLDGVNLLLFSTLIVEWLS